MARLLDDASTEYFENASDPIGSYPCTMAAWVYPDATGINHVAVGITDNSATNVIQLLWVNSSDQPVAQSRNGGTAVSAVSGQTLTINTWAHICAVFTGDADRDIYVNGGNVVNDTGNETWGGSSNVTNFGRRVRATQDRYWSGRLAEIGIWNVALTAANVASLGAGFIPLMVRPDALVTYAMPFWGPGSNADEYDYIGGLTFTEGGTSPEADHCPIIYPAGPISVLLAAAAGQPTMRRWGGVPYMAPGPRIQGRTW